MGNFINSTHDRPPEGPTNVYCTLRRDGKIKAVFCFHSKQITSIITRDRYDEIKANNGYFIINR